LFGAGTPVSMWES
jgi:hypothetical protein